MIVFCRRLLDRFAAARNDLILVQFSRSRKISFGGGPTCRQRVKRTRGRPVTGRVALVTGGARGMGAAHARRLSLEGASVVVADVLDEEGERLAAELRQDGRDVRFAHFDVTDSAQWAAIVRDVV